MGDSDFSQINQYLGVHLPSSYAEHFKMASGVLREDGLSLYSLEELVERNQIFGAPEYVPGFVLIGDDSGGRGIFLNCREPSDENVYFCDLGVMMTSEMVPFARSFPSWKLAGFPLPR